MRIRVASRLLLLGTYLAAVNSSLARARADEPAYSPAVAQASNEGQQAIARFRIPEDFEVTLWAAEPQLANPVTFAFDSRGRIYVAETFRQHKGVEDNRDHMDWLDDDLAAMTVEDRLAYFRKHLGDKAEEFRREHDRIRLLDDRDGDGRADVSTVFANGFNDILDGTGAGLLARDGYVWYTNIPHLWRLRDADGDGKADERTSLSRGYGVRVAFRGHDSHGLRMGPDGRMYFSIGDRGFNVTTREGTQLVYPDRGAVLRCNPDGSDLEVFASGLRNPQELVFNQYGDLFTCDNNSDSGDRARWVYVVDGGESGWRMNYQYLADRGPWNREKLWHPQHTGQAAYIVPPIANISDGPSGLTYNPGTGFPERYADHFFLCDFRGGHANSGIRSFALRRTGAAFEVTDMQEFAWSVLVTDADFGPDGALYFSDWVEGWDGPGKGRIYRIRPKSREYDSVNRAVKKLLADGFSHRPLEELAKLLEHANYQVRLEAQFALAARGSAARDTLAVVAQKSTSQLARLHAIWGLGKIGRSAAVRPDQQIAAVTPVTGLLEDSDPEIRAQAAKTLGDAHFEDVRLSHLLRDREPRVRFFAAIALGQMGSSGKAEPLIELLRENDDRDAYLRHAAVMGLTRLRDDDALRKAASDPSRAVRLGVLLALRRRASEQVARFLDDIDPSLVEEAARAIYDVPIERAIPRLAALAGKTGLTQPTLWRVINANYRLGRAANAAAVAGIAARRDESEPIRLEALGCLEQWQAPRGRDRVLGSWRPLEPRPPGLAAEALRGSLAGVFSGSDRIRQAATRVAVKLGIKEVGPALFEMVTSHDSPAESRREAVRALAALGDERAGAAIERALADASPIVRVEGRRSLAQRDPARALAMLGQALDTGELIERQAALATLAELNSDAVDALFGRLLDRLAAGEIPVEWQLDLVEAAQKRTGDATRQRLEAWRAARGGEDDPLGPWRLALAGGDAAEGRRIFFEKSEVSCLRCHKVGDTGGEVGPDLSKIGSQQKRDYLLEAIVLPDRQIAKGFDPVVIATIEGKVYSGIIRGDDGTSLTLVTAEGNSIRIAKADIDEQVRGKSAMPEDLVKKLTLRELRDLLEFLTGLK